MAVGIQILAFNNEQIDYLSMARFVARRAHDILKIPVSLVTDAEPGSYDATCFQHVATLPQIESEPNTRYYHDYDLKLSFRNRNRCCAYAHSPFDHTVLIDSDFLVNTENLNKLALYLQDSSYLIQDQLRKPDGSISYYNQWMGDFGPRLRWATVIAYRKDALAARLFQISEYVQENWDYYHSRFRFPRGLFRNDFAFTIADHLMQGGTVDADNQFRIPDYLQYYSAQANEPLVGITDRSSTILGGEKPLLTRVDTRDLHVMHKQSLMGFVTGQVDLSVE